MLSWIAVIFIVACTFVINSGDYKNDDGSPINKVIEVDNESDTDS